MASDRARASTTGSRIFISHSSRNNPQALALARWFEDNGWDDYFLDLSSARGLAPGERWQEALKTAADRCEAVVFLISPAWRDSRWCLAEFLLAKQLGKTIFGVLIEATPLDTLPPEMTTEWQLCDLVAGSTRRAFRVAEEPIVPETEVSFAEPGLARLKTGLDRAGLDATTFPWPPASDPTRVPYRGLQALDAEDAAVFFGRDAAIVRGLDVLRAMREVGVERMLAILGASGSGKSSFLRAGLLPRLARDDRHFLPLPVIRPERAVITGAIGLVASLEMAFRKAGAPKNRADIRTAVQDPAGLARLLTELQEIARARTRDDAPPTVVISIDQGEEFFGADGRTESEEMLSLLSSVLKASEVDAPEAIAARRRALAIVAIRSDSYERLQTEPRLRGVNPFLFNLPPIARTEFRAVIEGPADRHASAGHQLTVEPTLTDRLLQDAEGPDALPLLAFTLERLLVEHGADGELSLKDYEALGGVGGSIEAAVEAAFDQPGRDPVVPGDRAECERHLRLGFVPWLARVDPDTEERKRRVARWDEIPAEARPLLDRLIAQRLLVRDRRRLDGGAEETTVVEVAHEALLRQWPTLTVWLDADADALKTLEAVRRAAGEWVKNGRGDAWLLHAGERLRAAQTLRRRADFDRLLGADSWAYLDACTDREEAAHAEREAARVEREAQLQRIAEEQARVAQEQTRTARAQKITKRVVGCAAALVVAGGLGVVWLQRNVARQTSLGLASEAARASDARFYDRALRYAMVAARDSWLSPAAPQAAGQLARAAYSSLLITSLQGHEGRVRTAVFSPDGGRVVTASDDKTARVWDAATGQEMIRLNGHQGPVVAAAFSRDGRRVVTASRDNTARVWDAVTGHEVVRLQGHEDDVREVAFSADGRRVVTGSDDDTARVWDAVTGQQVALLQHADSVGAAAFNADGRRVMTASEDVTARVWDAATGHELGLVRGEREELMPWAAAFSADGLRVVTTSYGKPARVWVATTGQEVARLQGSEFTGSAAAFSPDGQRVVTPSDFSTARVWDAATGHEVARLQGHERSVVAVAFSPDGRRVVTASSDRTARVWNATTGYEVARLQGHEDQVDAAAFSADGRRVISVSLDQTVRIWNAGRDDQVVGLRGHEAHVLAAAFSLDGQRVTTAGRDGTRVWDAATGHELARARRRETLDQAALSPDGRLVVTASDDRTTRMLEAATGQELARLQGLDDMAAAAFSPDGRLVVTASYDGRAQVWDAATGQERVRLKGHNLAAAVAVAFSPDARRVVTGSSDRTARVWDAATGREVARLKGHHGSVEAAAFSPDGRRVVTGSDDKTARVWDAVTGHEVMLLRGHRASIMGVTFSVDGRRVMTASADAKVLVWDAATGQEIARLEGHRMIVVAAAFSPDGRRVVTASWDSTAGVWDVEWLTQDASGLLERVCKRRLKGVVRTLTDEDVRVAPILAGRSGEDVCAPSMFASWRGIVRSLYQPAALP